MTRRLHEVSQARLAVVTSVVAVMTLLLTSCGTTVEVGGWWIDPLAAGTVIAPGSSTKVLDVTGNGHYLSIHRASTASITVKRSTLGDMALQFPPTGMAAMVVAGSSSFNPGTADFEFNASVSITSTEAGPGANIMQKGLAGGPQWKMQVDDGVPSCRFADSAGKTVLWRGTAPKSIANGAWYRITCRKTATQVAIIVQLEGWPAAAPQVKNISLGSISNSAPVTVGSKGTTQSPDQFRGRMDNIGFRRL